MNIYQDPLTSFSEAYQSTLNRLTARLRVHAYKNNFPNGRHLSVGPQEDGSLTIFWPQEHAKPIEDEAYGTSNKLLQKFVNSITEEDFEHEMHRSLMKKGLI